MTPNAIHNIALQKISVKENFRSISAIKGYIIIIKSVAARISIATCQQRISRVHFILLILFSEEGLSIIQMINRVLCFFCGEFLTVGRRQLVLNGRGGHVQIVAVAFCGS